MRACWSCRRRWRRRPSAGRRSTASVVRHVVGQLRRAARRAQALGLEGSPSPSSGGRGAGRGRRRGPLPASASSAAARARSTSRVTTALMAGLCSSTRSRRWSSSSRLPSSLALMAATRSRGAAVPEIGHRRPSSQVRAGTVRTRCAPPPADRARGRRWSAAAGTTTPRRPPSEGSPTPSSTADDDHHARARPSRDRRRHVRRRGRRAALRRPRRAGGHRPGRRPRARPTSTGCGPSPPPPRRRCRAACGSSPPSARPSSTAATAAAELRAAPRSRPSILLIAYGNEVCDIDVPLFDSIAGV